MSTFSRLTTLAGKNPDRRAVLAARKARAKSRGRWMNCPACNASEFATRGSTDICDACLADLWGAQSIIQGAYKVANSTGLTAVQLPTRSHWLAYPHMAGSGERIPKQMRFSRLAGGGFSSDTANTAHTLQILYVELMTALSQVLPCDPESRKHAQNLIDSGTAYEDDETVSAALPLPAVRALRHLWQLFRWHSLEAFKQGFDKGHDLLSRMNLGQCTYEMFMEEIQEQSTQTQRQMDTIEKEPEQSRRSR